MCNSADDVVHELDICSGNVRHDLACIGGPNALTAEPLPAPVAILSNQLLFLGVNRNYWLPQGLEGAPPPVDMLELRIAIRMLGAFQRLAVGLR